MGKKKKNFLPTDAEILKFVDGEFRPLLVAGKDVEKVVIGWSKKTASNQRSNKTGPRYFMNGGTPYYLVSDLLEYFTKNPVETTNDQ